MSRKYQFDESFFDQIDSPIKAYWLGFIAADGNVSTDAGTYRLRFEIAMKDKDHLYLLQQHIKSNYPITMRQHLSPGRDGAESRKECMRLEIFSQHLVTSLIYQGISPRKSGIVKPWNGPSDLMSHYWRGLFDGDGSIGKKRKDQWWLSICGSRDCVFEFSHWAKLICGSNAVPFGDYNSPNFWSWAVEGVGMSQKLAIALYYSAPVSLNRKQQIANELIRIEGNHSRRKISEDDLLEIHKKYTSGITQKQLSFEYGVTQQAISKIVRGAT